MTELQFATVRLTTGPRIHYAEHAYFPEKIRTVSWVRSAVPGSRSIQRLDTARTGNARSRSPLIFRRFCSTVDRCAHSDRLDTTSRRRTVSVRHR
jgi:hypothetical protein